MFETGFVILLGFVFIAIKLPRWLILRLLGWPLAVDLGVSVLAYVLHWGTFSGVMAAAVAGMLTSLCTTLGRKWVGYVDSRGYTRGWTDWSAFAIRPKKEK